MNEITKSITFLKEYKQLRQAVDEGKTPVLAVGLSAIHKAHLAAALGLDTGRPVLVLTDDDNAANRFAADLRGFSERDIVQLPSRELVMADVVGVSRGYEQRRLAALDELTEAHFAVASVQAAAQRTMPPEALKAAIVSLATGETAPLDELAQSLTRAGYERCVQVEGTGQFSIRGGILDVFPPQAEHPYRVEFWDDEIDSISTFDVGSQRRLEQCECLRCLPCMESIPALVKGGAAGLAKAILALTSTRRKKQHADLQANLERDAERLRETGSLPAADKYMPLIYPEMATAFDYLPENAIVIIEDTPRLRDAVRDFHARVADDVTALLERGEMPPNLGEYALDFVGVCSVKRQILRLDSFLNNVAELTPQHLENFIANQMNAYGGNLDMASADIRSYTEQGRAVAVVCGSALRCQNMLDALTDTGLNVKISDLLPKGGCVNIMEGTLSAGFEYPDLGLLVVDEEQRFGVGHKETLKEMSKNVDVLTLSATPIPRTLNMALSGIRDMSSIEEPPQNRHPVQTFVLEQNDGVLLDAIRRELGRGGQVYYLHNRVESIERCANMWQQRLPDARIGIVHGKMGQKEIAKVMNEMADGEIDILVCTTIIETGIDIPNANTLIIENADNMGLAQLHQIRGRVGRSSRHAYAYLCYRHGKALSEIAQKRLGAIREFAAFGSGFKIAMRDLEIRGAGNVLGPEQSGHMMSVGYDLYLKLLEEAVQEEKGETPKPRVDCAAELLISANLPADYVADAGQRVDLYRRIALIRTDEQRSDMLDELIDRFGEPPAEAIALLDIALLRAKASEQGIAEIKQQDGRLLLTFSETDFARLSALCGDSEFKGRLLLNAGSTPYLSLRLNKGETAMEMAQTLVDKYAATAK